MQHSSAPKGDIRFNCPVAARCGGCQLARLSYREQLSLKQRRVEELLGSLCPVEPILGMDNPLHYRSKVHAVLAVDKRGDPISGVYEQGTHRVVPVKHCLIEDTRADRIIQTIVSLLKPFRIRVYNEYTHRGFLRHVVVRTSPSTGQIMVTLVATSLEFPGRKAFVAALVEKHPEITTIVLNLNQRQTSMVLGTKETVLYGSGTIEDELCGKRFRISSRSFYQVNGRQTERLYRTAIQLAGLTGGETLLDAYCGTGTIGLCASDGLKRLIGVELNGEAVKDARENARRNGVTNASFYCDDAGRFMVKMARDGRVPDVVIMDPPRSGSDEPFLRSLLTLKPPRIVYVSCNPETLARDAACLVQGGYRAEKAVPVDMFPGTEHVETVCLLVRRNGPHIDIDVDVEEMLQEKRGQATYTQIKEYVLEQTGLKVSSLYISQVKRKCGLDVGESYNKPKTDDSKQPQCPPEKKEAIMNALRHFGVI